MFCLATKYHRDNNAPAYLRSILLFHSLLWSSITETLNPSISKKSHKTVHQRFNASLRYKLPVYRQYNHICEWYSLDIISDTYCSVFTLVVLRHTLTRGHKTNISFPSDYEPVPCIAYVLHSLFVAHWVFIQYSQRPSALIESTYLLPNENTSSADN